MPVDIHPKEKVSGVELILTRLHAGGKFSDTNYKFAGGLHGVGVSVVNALSKHLECWVRRGGKEYNISFRNGKVTSKLEVVGEVGKNNTGTTVRVLARSEVLRHRPSSRSRSSSTCSRPRPCCARVCASGCTSRRPARRRSGSTPAASRSTCANRSTSGEWLPDEPFTGNGRGRAGRRRLGRRLAASTAARAVEESYVNLIPTPQGGTHVNGFRLGPHRGRARVLRVPQPAAARPQARARGRLGRRELRAVDEDARSAVRRPDQGAPVVARIRGVRLRHRQGPVRAVAQPASGGGRADRAARDRERAGRA